MIDDTVVYIPKPREKAPRVPKDPEGTNMSVYFPRRADVERLEAVARELGFPSRNALVLDVLLEWLGQYESRPK